MNKLLMLDKERFSKLLFDLEINQTNYAELVGLDASVISKAKKKGVLISTAKKILNVGGRDLSLKYYFHIKN